MNVISDDGVAVLILRQPNFQDRQLVVGSSPEITMARAEAAHHHGAPSGGKRLFVVTTAAIALLVAVVCVAAGLGGGGSGRSELVSENSGMPVGLRTQAHLAATS